MTNIMQEDVISIFNSLSDQEKALINSKNIMITGFGGSLGYMLMTFLKEFGDHLSLGRVYGIDNYIFGQPEWISEFEDDNRFVLYKEDITTFDLSKVSDVNIIFHMASLASPVYYRLHPIETIDADVIGLRRLLDFFRDRNISDLLFFSTSEIYGNPDNIHVPTKETYWGNVNTSGPRACYDESKRFGETLCYNYNNVYHMPVTVIRPFNSFGPGLRTNDKRVVADFAMNIINHEDLVIYSDGKATRSFCYAVDTIIGILKCALYGKYGIFNIGSDIKEITIDELAQMYKTIGKVINGYKGDIVYKVHEDKHYLTDNPQRRLPDLSMAKNILNYYPKYTTEQGIERYLRHILEAREV